MFSNRKDESAVWLEFASNVTNRRVGYIPSEPIVRNLEGDGDFRSDECIDLMKRAEIVVTNPPFSLFREYVAQLIEHKKKFLILGSQNAITYKEIFPLIKNKKMWLGLDNGGTKWFEVKPHYTIKTQSRQKEENGKKYFSMGNITWFTNLDHSKRHEKLILYKRYSPEEYQKYDNYDAIEVSRIESIPTDYAGAMGVPITFLDKHNPNQFELLGATESEGKGFSNGLWFPDSGVAQPVIRGKRVYKRLFIRNRRPQS